MADSWLTELSVIPTAFAGGDSRKKIGYRALTVPLSPIFYILSPAPTGVGGTTGFVGDWWRTADYDRRRRIIANPPKPTARSERADGSGTMPKVAIPRLPEVKAGEALME